MSDDNTKRFNQTVRGPSIPLGPNWTAERLAAERAKNPRAFARAFGMQAYSDAEGEAHASDPFTSTGREGD